jgi:cell division protein FtsZ
MNNSNSSGPAKALSIKLFGVGGAGIQVLELITATPLPGATLVALDIDPDSVSRSSAPEKISLELRQLRGLSTGGDPERGRALAEHHLPKLKAVCEGADVIFILTGLGGGAGTGISPLLAQAAKETGALVLAFATFPFDCEGNRRQHQAQHGFQELKALADGVISLPNQKLFKLIDDTTSVRETFKLSNELLAEGVINVWRLIACKGLIEVHFDDLCALLRERHGESAFASAEAAGPERSREVVDKLLAHPMLDGGKILGESIGTLVSLIGGPDLTMAEINYVMEQFSGKCPKAQVIMGAAVDDQFGGRLAATLVVSRRTESLLAKAGIDEAAHEAARPPAEDLPSQLVNRLATPRPQSRFVPPPPALSAEKMEQMMNSDTATPPRRRKMPPKMRQGQLPLEIVSKGRFDKSEPTIHKGEDLDVPTYIRRGVSLN